MLKTKTYDDLSGSYLTSGADMQMKRCALDAFNETINMFREQIKLQDKMQNEGQPHEIKRYVAAKLINVSMLCVEGCAIIFFIHFAAFVVMLICCDIDYGIWKRIESSWKILFENK